MCCQDFSQRGFRIPKVFYASYNENFDVRPTLEALEAEGLSYVAKASHLCCAQGVFVMDKGFDRFPAEICLNIVQRDWHFFVHGAFASSIPEYSARLDSRFCRFD